MQQQGSIWTKENAVITAAALSLFSTVQLFKISAFCDTLFTLIKKFRYWKKKEEKKSYIFT